MGFCLPAGQPCSAQGQRRVTKPHSSCSWENEKLSPYTLLVGLSSEPNLTSGSLSEGQNLRVGWKGALFKLGTMIVGKNGEAFLAKWTGDDAPLVTFKQGGFFSSCKWILTSYRVLRKKKVNSTIMSLFGGLYQVFLFCMYGFFFAFKKNSKKDICFS